VAPERPAWLQLAVALRWPAVLVLALVVALVALERTCHRVGEEGRATVSQLGEAAATIAERFRTGTITTTFTAAIPRLVPDGALKLEVAAVEATETVARSDERRVLFDLVSLGTTVTEIRVPVTYRYHLRLDEPWTLDVRGHDCLVRAPPIRPTLPPAIHTDRMEKRSESGWLRFDAADQMASLERQLTPTFTLRAGNRDHLGLVRETCRSRVAEFVRSWLLAEEHWRRDRFSSVTVVFADEPRAETAAPPTLRLETPRE